MFNIAVMPRITRPVPLLVEVDGKTEDHSFTATFQIIDIDKSTSELLGDDEGQRAFLEQVIVGLDDIAGPDQAPIPFSPELRRAVINRFDARTALIKVYFGEVQKLASGN